MNLSIGFNCYYIFVLYWTLLYFHFPRTLMHFICFHHVNHLQLWIIFTVLIYYCLRIYLAFCIINFLNCKPVVCFNLKQWIILFPKIKSFIILLAIIYYIYLCIAEIIFQIHLRFHIIYIIVFKCYLLIIIIFYFLQIII